MYIQKDVMINEIECLKTFFLRILNILIHTYEKKTVLKKLTMMYIQKDLTLKLRWEILSSSHLDS